MRLARTIRLSLALAGGALVAFHGWLFAGQVVAGQLNDPWLVLRWLAAALLIVALIAVRRSGAAMFGRKSVAIWVLAALLHGPAISDLQAEFDSFALPETVAAAVVQLVSSAALGAGLLLLAALLFARARAVAMRFPIAREIVQGRRPGPALSPHFSPRPPPVCAQ